MGFDQTRLMGDGEAYRVGPDCGGAQAYPVYTGGQIARQTVLRDRCAT